MTTNINEIKLSRVITKMNDDKHVIAIITAFRWDNSAEENVANNKKIASECREKFMGFVFVDGYWIEDGSDATEPVPEVSLLIDVNTDGETELFDWCVSIAKKYNQDAFVFKGITHEFGLYGKDGKKVPIDIGNKVSVDKLAQAYSRLKSGSHKGRSFVFENVRAQEYTSFVHALANNGFGL
jgi:hypothetical protein